jgi:phosphoenolpyruvate-protein kinase (PTS system EI component)
MMVGNVGVISPVPKPSSAVVAEALSLLSTFGDSKGLAKVLGQMKEVQQANEKVLAEAQAGIAELTKLHRDLEQSRTDHAAQVSRDKATFDQRTEDLARDERRLNERQTLFEDEKRSAQAALSQRTHELNQATKAVHDREIKCDERAKGLTVLERQVNQRLDETNALRDSLSRREARLRQALDSD